MAQSRLELVRCTCPLSGVKRTSALALHTSTFGPKRTCTAERCVANYLPPLSITARRTVSVIYSALMPAISITFAHFGISARMRLENSSGVLSIVPKPRDASF